MTKEFTKNRLLKLVTVILVITVISSVATVLATMSANQNVLFNGSISAVNLGVYSDSGCTQNCTSLNVGMLNSGGTSRQTVYVKNSGNVPETLTMAVNNWNPPNANLYLTLTWNQQNTILPAGQSAQAILTLTAASNTGSLTTFGFSVTFTGTQ